MSFHRQCFRADTAAEIATTIGMMGKIGCLNAAAKACKGRKENIEILQNLICEIANMRQKKLFVGQHIRNLRDEQGLTQAAFAESIGLSTSYLNQIENNQRHVSANVLVALAERYSVDIASFSSSDADRRLSDVLEIFSDPALKKVVPGRQEMLQACQSAPNLIRALIHLHQLYRKTAEQVDELGELHLNNGTVQSTFEEVRDFFHYQGNYFDEIDRKAELLASQMEEGGDLLSALKQHLRRTHKTDVLFEPDPEHMIFRRFDREARTIYVNPRLAPATQIFELAHHVGLMEQASLIDQIANKADFQSEDAAAICKIGLANYFAGAFMMPYVRFHEAAKRLRHDLELLADEFGCSLEQVAHRLSTLQRPRKKGTPFFFARVDQAGNITKRHSATSLQFARFGSACPLWNVHQAFETPNRVQRQLAETPDGNRYLCLAIAVTKKSGGFRDPVRRYAIALGCEIRHASSIVYADDLPIEQKNAYEAIGVSCRICSRQNCHQRSVPPIRMPLQVDPFERGPIPYKLA